MEEIAKFFLAQFNFSYMRTLKITSRRNGRETKYPSFVFVLRVSLLFSLPLDVKDARRHLDQKITQEKERNK